jgi:hypothetical protein
MQKIYQMKMESARDWTGNGKSTFGTLGASNHTVFKRYNGKTGYAQADDAGM